MQCHDKGMMRTGVKYCEEERKFDEFCGRRKIPCRVDDSAEADFKSTPATSLNGFGAPLRKLRPAMEVQGHWSSLGWNNSSEEQSVDEETIFSANLSSSAFVQSATRDVRDLEDLRDFTLLS